MLNRSYLPFLGLALLAACALTATAQQAPKTHLKVGDKAPEFKLGSTKGGQVSLADFAGKSTVVRAFFPAAFTGG